MFFDDFIFLLRYEPIPKPTNNNIMGANAIQNILSVNKNAIIPITRPITKPISVPYDKYFSAFHLQEFFLFFFFVTHLLAS